MLDFTLDIDETLAEGNKVVTRVRVKGINIDRIADGRIAEHWGEADTVGMLRQMGVDPFAGRKTS